MPTLGGLLKKKRTKDSVDLKDAGSSAASTTAESSNTSGSSNPIRHIPTNSSQTSHELSQSESNQYKKLNQQQAPTSSAKDDRIDQSHPQLAATTNKEATAGIRVDGPSSISMEGRVGSAAAAPTPRVTKGKYTLTDFTLQRTLGTGSFGRVHLVQSKHNQRFYAVKVLKKAQVVKMKQVEHTNDERRMLQKVKHPFLITLWGTFQDSKNLYMVMDFVEGGELFSLLRKSQVIFIKEFDRSGCSC